MYNDGKKPRRIRSMDKGMLLRVMEYCMGHKIPCEYKDDHMTPLTVYFYTTDYHYERILAQNGLREH